MELACVALTLRRLPTWVPIRKYGLIIVRRMRDRQSGNVYKYFRPFQNYYQIGLTDEKDEDCVICLNALRHCPNESLFDQSADVEANTKAEMSGYF